MQLINSDVRSHARDRSALVMAGSSREHGAALIISLVILVVITVIGIGSMNSSILQERMSANAQNARQAFFSAEAANQDLFRKLEPMDSSSAEWKRALDAQDAGILVAGPTKSYGGGASGSVATSEVRYLGEAQPLNYSMGEDIETYRHRFEIIGDATVTGTGATDTVFRGVQAVFY
ncbi:PilX N-terminal domain-containing pilus assembly protein [Marinobacter sp. S0848L]|uniref:pilus assembly PilX family protein n=1 Tax=Marinobacter sp. S0848L TaxID=2926423 RepID=UPI001FF3DE31|nr:PilX N-terminal domain-containing pilus assembly protein [Marinobacter sp. S0848L]MCK0107277.1 PilX N-terminal domain-containing pilus assembly protein [Marinobacter sp. S0848L]